MLYVLCRYPVLRGDLFKVHPQLEFEVFVGPLSSSSATLRPARRDFKQSAQGLIGLSRMRDLNFLRYNVGVLQELGS